MLDAVQHWYFGLTSAEQLSAFMTLFAGASLLLAFQAYLRSGKALRLAMSQEHRNAPRLKLRYDGSTWTDVGDSRQFTFQVSISNQSDFPASITLVGLDLTYELQQRSNVLRLNATELRSVDGTRLSIPSNLPPRGSLGGDVRFDVPLEIIAEASVRRHTLRVIDSHDNTYEFPVAHVARGR